MALFEYILKSKSGVYKDTPENRRLHRVGQRYGLTKESEKLNGDSVLMTEIEAKIKAIEKNVPLFKEVISAVNLEVGCYSSSVNMKKPNRILEKMKNDGLSLHDIKDILRSTFVCDKEDDIQSVIDAIGKHLKIARIKKQTPENFNGYSGYIVNVELPDGSGVAEMQINTPQMIWGKEMEVDARNIIGNAVWDKLKRNAPQGLVPGMGHKMYELLRSAASDVQRIAEVKRESFSYYELVRKIKL